METILSNPINGYADKGWLVTVARSVQELNGMRDIWQQMQRHPNVDMDFYLTIMDIRRNALRPHVILFTQHGVPRAMVVGRIEENRMPLRLGYITIPGFRMRSLSILYGGLLGDITYDSAPIVFEELLQTLRNGEAQALFFHYLPIDSELYPLVREKPGFLWRDHLPDSRLHYLLTLSHDAADFFSHLSTKRKYELRRLPRALEKNFPGKVKYKCFSTKEEVNRLFSDAESIARKTYQRGLNVGFLNDVETKRRILLAAQKSQLIAYLIYIDNEPCAFWIGIIYGHILHLDFTGYDPSFKRYQVGTIGFAKMIDHVRSNYRYVTQIDFGFGSSTFKEHFGTESHNEVSLYAFAPTLRNFYVNAARSIVIGSGKSLISVLKKMRLEGMVKKRWRARLQKTQAV